MSTRIVKSMTNGTRNMIYSDFSEITTDKPEKSLLAKKDKNSDIDHLYPIARYSSNPFFR